MQEFKRQHKSVLILEKDGQISFDGILKYNEDIKIVNKKQENEIKRKSKQKIDIQEHIQANEGAFIHLIYKYGKPLMDKLQAKCKGNKSNIHIIRLIQLSTYSTFGGKLFDSNKNRIKKSSLSKIWDVKDRKGINETYNLLLECGYIYETEEDYIMISDDLIVKGAINDFKKLRKQDADLTYTRVFTKNVQDMYLGTEPKARKQLANLFKVLPYINFTHNVFCKNPTETDEAKLELLTWTDLARLCGYDDKKQVSRFKKDLWTLKIYNYNTIGEFTSSDGKAICINPKVYYAGNDINNVRNLYAMFKMTSN